MQSLFSSESVVYYASVINVSFKCAKNASCICRIHMGFQLGEDKQNQFVSFSSKWWARSVAFVYQTNCVAFSFFRDQRNDFLRTVIQVRLGKALPQYVVTTSDVKGGSIRGYLREVVDSLRMLSVRFSMEYLCSVTRKTLYKDLVDTMLPIPLYRSVNWGGQGDDVLKRVKKCQLDPLKKRFSLSYTQTRYP